MPIPGSGPLSLTDIQTEFGGTNPISISEYYGAATGVPASGAISFSNFYGTSAEGVEFIDLNGSYFASNLAPSDARIEVRFKSDGLVYTSTNGGAEVLDGRWWSAGSTTGIGNDYEIRATYSSGDTINIGSAGTWLSLSATRTFGMLETSNLSNTRSGSITIEIRDVATSTVQSSIVITLTAQTDL